MALNTIANLFDLSGKSSGSYLTSGGSFREKFGEGLFTDEQKRLNQYSDQDIQAVSAQNHRKLEKAKASAVDLSEGDLVATTGSGRNRVAKTVDQQFTPLENNLAFRLQAGPLRA